jgi:hypothetical protein
VGENEIDQALEARDAHVAALKALFERYPIPAFYSDAHQEWRTYLLRKVRIGRYHMSKRVAARVCVPYDELLAVSMLIYG